MTVGIVRRCSKVFFGDIAGVNAGFRAEQEKILQHLGFIIGALQRDGGLTRVEVRQQTLTQRQLSLGFLVLLLGFLLALILPPRHGIHVREQEFGIDHLNVTNRINGTIHVMNVPTLKAAHHMHNGIHLANVTEELIPEPLPLAGALDEACDVHKLNRCRNQFLRTRELGKRCQALVWHRHDALVRLDGAKRVIRRLRLAGASHSVEKSGFTDVGEPNNTCLEHKAATLEAKPPRRTRKFEFPKTLRMTFNSQDQGRRLFWRTPSSNRPSVRTSPGLVVSVHLTPSPPAPDKRSAPLPQAPPLPRLGLLHRFPGWSQFRSDQHRRCWWRAVSSFQDP